MTRFAIATHECPLRVDCRQHGSAASSAPARPAGLCSGMGARASHLRFAMPASQGALKASTLSLQLGPWLRKVLAPELSVEMHVAESYAALADDLRAGRVDAAWAPPFVCAQVERDGGRWLAQFERGGCTTFRAAFVCRVDHPLVLEALDGVSVAWVAPESASGYLLPARVVGARRERSEGRVQPGALRGVLRGGRWRRSWAARSSSPPSSRQPRRRRRRRPGSTSCRQRCTRPCGSSGTRTRARTTASWCPRA